jgi:crossover junction endodeoxyribonuclease RusA
MTTELRSWRIKLPWERPPLSLNDRLHWRPERKLKIEIREAAHWLAKGNKIPPLQRVRVTLEWVVPDERIRDIDNPIATYKCLADGLVNAGVVPDDNPKYMDKSTMVDIVLQRGVRGTFLLIEELDPLDT